MMRLVGLTVGVVVAVAPARAEQYWIAYEGNDFPENEGWVRHVSDPPAQRWLEGGRLSIDSRVQGDVYENYGIYFDDGLDPEPGETFVMGWRLQVGEVIGFADPGVFVISDDLYAVTFIFSEQRVWGAYEANASAHFEPGLFHEFELRSGDMRGYELYIDGELAIQGVFRQSFFSTRIGWGDIVSGSGGLGRWDYFRFGVVPEPATAQALVLGLLVWRITR